MKVTKEDKATAAAIRAAANMGGTVKKKKPVKKVATKKSTKKVVAKKTERTPREQSKSGNFKSIRHLMEVSFAKNKDLTKDEAIAIVKKEFPKASFIINPTSHFGWYKSHIVGKYEFKHVDAPKWTKGVRAKIKGE
jgi:hypothetical protein